MIMKLEITTKKMNFVLNVTEQLHNYRYLFT